MPREFIPRPWLMSALAQKKSGCVIGQDIPGLLLTIKWHTARLKAYKLAKENVAYHK
ncbi:MAG: hypothetical protein R3E31_05495 [Chloroflexota bacterium]